MDPAHNFSRWRQVRTLLIVFGAGLVSALALSLSMLYFYNPAGIYIAQYLLFTPENLMRATAPQRAGRVRDPPPELVQALFSWYDRPQEKWIVRVVDLDDYKAFYAMIEGDKSLPSVPDEVKNLFEVNPPYVLAASISVKYDKAKEASTQAAQAQFGANSDYYRILLPQPGLEDQWIYFHHASVKNDQPFSLQLFNLFLKR